MPEPIQNENIIPENNQELDSVVAAIDESVNPVASQQDLDTIAQANAQFTPPPADTLTPQTAVGNLGQAALMPTLNQPINVGQSSGSIIGSHGVYVNPGFVAPHGVFMEQQKQRQVAQQQQDELANKAAREVDLAKRARDKAFQFERPDVPISDDPHFQKNLDEIGNNVINSYVDQAKDLWGKDWQVGIKSDTRLGREFQSSMDGVNILARNANLMVEKFAEVKAGLKSGDTYYSPSVVEAFRKYEQAIGSAFEDGDIKALGEVRQLLGKIDGELELNTFLQDKGILSNIKGEITGSTGISDMGDFLKLKKTNRTSYDKNIDAIVKNIRKAKGPDTEYTDDDIRTVLEGHLQNTSKSSATLVSKKDKSGKMSEEDVSINKGGRVVSVSSLDNEGKPAIEEHNFKVTIPVKQIKGGVKLDGLQKIDNDGNLVAVPDIQNLEIIEFGVEESVQNKKPDKFGKLKAEYITSFSAKYKVKEPVMELDLWGNVVESGKFEDVEKTGIFDASTVSDQLRFHYGDPVNDALEGSKRDLTEGVSLNIGNESYTEKELRDDGWKDAEIEALKKQQ